MKTEFRASFKKDLKRLKPPVLRQRIKDVIEHVEEADTIYQIQNLKKLQGGEDYYRIRLGDYRFGLKIEDDIVIFIRFLHRKDIYRYFP